MKECFEDFGGTNLFKCFCINQYPSNFDNFCGILRDTYAMLVTRCPGVNDNVKVRSCVRHSSHHLREHLQVFQN